MSHIGGVLKESSFLLGGQLYFMAMNIVLTMMLTHLLSVEDFGRYVYAQSVIVMLSAFGFMGLQGAVTQFTAYHQGKNNSARMKGILFGLGRDVLFFNTVLAAAVFLAGYYYGDLLLNKEGVGILVAILALTYPMRGITGVIVSFFQGLRMMRFVAILQNVSEQTMRFFLLSVLLLGALSNIHYLIGGLAVIFFMNMVFALFLYRRYVSGGIRKAVSDTIDRREIYGYALPLLLMNLSIVALSNLEVAMVGYLATLEDAAVYRVYKLAVFIILSMVSAITMSYHPTITRMIAAGDTNSLRILYHDVSRWMLYVGLAASFLLVTVGPLVAGTLFGPEYRISTPVTLVLLGLGVIIISASGPNAASLQAFGNTMVLAALSVLSIIALVGLGVILIPLYGIDGAAMAFVISQLIQQGLGALILFRWRRLSPFDKRHAVLLILTCVALTLAVFTVAPGFEKYEYSFSAVTVSMLTALTFAYLAVRTNIVPEQDKKVFVKVLNNLSVKMGIPKSS